ncbi:MULTISPECIES: hypothetical protein [Atopobium]|uniref:Uncharacterized protein n=1 Tax=Atopobium minutum 10063974 TaxID=997872 RepID=N2BQY7_9ACTN|nr:MULTISPECIES: hypothetical protein [Atopobium]EMZ42686.1 hypothetical protein HMPREF1091_00244 [Atopobium minutum 10063974]ERL15338.1 hypothetical protein HMPREF1247_0809 [Atopobium sp. BV3Ac4]
METTLATTAPSLPDQMSISKALAQSDIIPVSYRGKAANVLVAMQFGQSMGLSPAESLYRINVINGKPTMSAELVAAQVRKAGHKLRISKDEKHMSATCTIVRCDDPDYPFSATRDASWAHQMKLDTKDNYQKQPLTMLTWRAITACAREACPEALFGVAYTPDEMFDFASAEHMPKNSPDTPQEPIVVEAEQVSVEPQTTSQNGSGATDRMQPIRNLFAGYREARGGIDSTTASAELAAVMGARSMSDELTDEQIATCVAAMQDTISRFEQINQPDYAQEDIEF